MSRIRLSELYQLTLPTFLLFAVLGIRQFADIVGKQLTKSFVLDLPVAVSE
jgi:hypothetical protein